MRLKNKLIYHTGVGSKIDPNSIKIPPMLVQPFIENSLIHGILPKDDGGKLVINFTSKGKELAMVIEDSGVGRKNSHNNKNNHQSLGMKFTKSRLDSISAIYKFKTNLEIIDLINNNREPLGTKVIISLPLIEM